MKPITPEEAVRRRADPLDPRVIDTWNKMITEKIRPDRRAVISQPEIIDALIEAIGFGCTRADVIEGRWLDIEDLYRAAGWDVVYQKAHYVDNYESTFTFSLPSK